MLKPKDINEVQFSRAFKGYDPDEVDQFLDQVTEDYSRLFRENAELMHRLDELAAKVSEFKNAEDTLRAAKEKIYRMAQEVASKAKAEAAQTEREARERAERIVIEAKRDCENQRRLYERLQLEVTRFKAKAVALFKSEIEQLNTMPDIQIEPKEELRIRADEMSEDDALSSPFVEEYKPKYVPPRTIDFGVTETEAKAEELKATADPEKDFTSDYVYNQPAEADAFSFPEKENTVEITETETPPALDLPEPAEEPAPAVIAEEPAVGPIAEEPAVQEPVAAQEPAAEEPAPAVQEEIKPIDLPEEPERSAFTIRRVTQENSSEPPAAQESTASKEAGNQNSVTAAEIADSIPDPEPAGEGRMENGWYNKTEEFDLVDTEKHGPRETAEPEKSSAHPKFGQLRFGADYDINEEGGDAPRGFGFFRKKK